MQFRKQEMNTLVARISVQCKSETDYVSHAVGFDNGRDKWNGMHFYFLSVSMLKMYAIFKSVDHPQVQVMVSENFFFVLFRVLMLFSKFQTLLFCTGVSSALRVAWLKPKTHTFPLVYFFHCKFYLPNARAVNTYTIMQSVKCTQARNRCLFLHRMKRPRK